MNNWKHDKLDALVKIDPEQLDSSTDENLPFYYIDISSVTSGVISFPAHTIIFKDSPSRARKTLRNGDVLMSSVRPNLKAFAKFISPDTNSTFVASTGFAVLREKASCDINYIYHCLFSNPIENQITSLVVGSNYPAINTKDIRELKIYLPKSKIEQTKIASVLDTIDLAILTTGKLIAKYQRVKTGLLQELLTKGIDTKGNIRSKNTHKFVVKSGIEVPIDWSVMPFKDCCSLIKDGTHLPPKRVHEGVFLLGVTNIIEGEWKLHSSDTLVSEEFYNQMHKNWEIEATDVLLAIVGATIGKVTQVPTDFPKFTLQRSICLLRGKKNILSNDYLRLFIESDYFQRILWNEVNVTAQPGIYLDAIGKFLLLKPPIEEQERISKRIQLVKTNIDDLKKSLQKYRIIKAGLMQDLLSGKVRAM